MPDGYRKNYTDSRISREVKKPLECSWFAIFDWCLAQLWMYCSQQKKFNTTTKNIAFFHSTGVSRQTLTTIHKSAQSYH